MEAKCKKCGKVLNHKNCMPTPMAKFLSEVQGRNDFRFDDYCNECCFKMFISGESKK